MGFATRHDLIARSNARRVAQLAFPADMDMAADEMLRVALDEGDLSVYPEADQAALAIALDTIDKCLADADALLVSYGIPPTVQTTLLARLASTVAMYYLQQGERMTEDTLSAYESVIDLLKQHSKGTIDLVPNTDDQESTADGFAQIESAPPRFGYRRQS